jgi:hypothetical protein
MVHKDRRNGILIGFSIIALLVIFVLGVSLVEYAGIQITQPIEEGEDIGKLEFIPTVSVTNNNTVTMKLRYITIKKNVNLFEYIFDHEESAITNTNHTKLYKLSLSSEDNTTRVYRIEKIVNGTFIRILRMSDDLLGNLTSDNGIVYKSVGFGFEVKTDAGNVYLYLTQIPKPEVEDTKA